MPEPTKILFVKTAHRCQTRRILWKKIFKPGWPIRPNRLHHVRKGNNELQAILFRSQWQLRHRKIWPLSCQLPHFLLRWQQLTGSSHLGVVTDGLFFQLIGKRRNAWRAKTMTFWRCICARDQKVLSQHGTSLDASHIPRQPPLWPPLCMLSWWLTRSDHFEGSALSAFYIPHPPRMKTF